LQDLERTRIGGFPPFSHTPLRTPTALNTLSFREA
jgi:hypothetical protein